MRILHLVKKFDFGGAENHVRDLANVMKEMGNEVFVIARRGKQNDLLDTRVNFINLRMFDCFILLQIPYIVHLIRKNNIQVLHAHQRLPALFASLAGKIAGIPVIVTVHGQTQHDLRSKFTKMIPDKFIYVRQNTYKESVRYGIPEDKSVFIQNGVSITRTSKKRDFNSICYISRIDKRHASVISLIIKKVIAPVSLLYPGIKFNIVGDGPSLGSLRHEAELINKQLGRDAVIIHGYVSDVKKIVNGSGLILGVGRVAIESLACGVPVLSVNYKCMGELVSMKNYSFFRLNNFVSLGSPPPDETSLIDALESYFRNIPFWQGEAVAIQKEIEKDFDIYRIGKEITDLYSEVIALNN